MKKQPLAEVFGFPISNLSEEAQRYRSNRLCPFGNRVPSCTKDKVLDPLGVCSVYDGRNVVITCPIRFRENWIVADDASKFFFQEDQHWTSLSEIRLKDNNGVVVGNIDIVLVSYDDRGKVTDFGALEIQAVYISGNIRHPFNQYMLSPHQNSEMDWSHKVNYPRPDFLSSSRKRLAPQMLFKGGILYAWGKKQAVAIDKHFFSTLPDLPQVPREEAEIAWLIYDLQLDAEQNRFHLIQDKIVYTRFEPALLQITVPEVGELGLFVEHLQNKLDQKLDNNPPDAPLLTDIESI